MPFSPSSLDTSAGSPVARLHRAVTCAFGRKSRGRRFESQVGQVTFVETVHPTGDQEVAGSTPFG